MRFNKIGNGLLFSLIYCSTLLSCSDKTRDTNNLSISDLLPLSGDTLLAVKHDFGLLISTDYGKSWKFQNTSILLKQLTIDQNKILWGLDYWIGIHEESYSKLYFSKDMGATWQVVVFHPQRFFPVKIVSSPFEKLSIQTYDNKEFDLEGYNLMKDWRLKKDLPYNEEHLLESGAYKLLKDGYVLKKNKDATFDTVTKINNISIPFQILFHNDTLFIAGSCDGGYKGCLAALNTSDKYLHWYDVKGIQTLGIRRDGYGNIWVFGDGGIFLKIKDSIYEKLSQLTSPAIQH